MILSRDAGGYLCIATATNYSPLIRSLLTVVERRERALPILIVNAGNRIIWCRDSCSA